MVFPDKLVMQCIAIDAYGVATKFTFFTADIDLNPLWKGLLYRARICLRHDCQLSVSFVPKKIGPQHNGHDGVKNPHLLKCVMQK